MRTVFHLPGLLALTSLALALEACTLWSYPTGVSAWEIERQEVRLLHDAEAGRLAVATGLTLVNRTERPQEQVTLCLGAVSEASIVVIRDAASRRLTPTRTARGGLAIRLAELVEPGGRTRLWLEYSLDTSATATRGIIQRGDWLAISERANILPSVEGPPQAYRLNVTCRAAPGMTGVVCGSFEPLEGPPSSVTRFRSRHPSHGLACVFGPLRLVRTGSRTRSLMVWVAPETSSSRCQELGRLVSLIDRALADLLGREPDAEPIVLVEQPTLEPFASGRTLFLPSTWIRPLPDRTASCLALEVGSVLAGREFRNSGPRHVSDDLAAGLAAFLTIRCLERVGRPDLAREITVNLATRYRTKASLSIPSRPMDRSFGALLATADITFSPVGRSLIVEATRRLLQDEEAAGSRESPGGAMRFEEKGNEEIRWQDLRQGIEAALPVGGHRAVLDWLERPVPPEIRYSWSSSTEPTGTRTVLFARVSPPIPLRTELLLWSPRTHKTETITLDIGRPDTQLTTPFLPRWVELDPARLLPGEIVAESAPAGDPRRGTRILKSCVSRLRWTGQPPIESLTIGAEERLTWTHDRGLWLNRPDLPEIRLATAGLSILSGALDGSLEVRALPDRTSGGRTSYDLEILERGRPSARLEIQPDSYRLRSILLLDEHGHRQALLEMDRFIETEGGVRPSRVRLLSPALLDPLLIEAPPVADQSTG